MLLGFHSYLTYWTNFAQTASVIIFRGKTHETVQLLEVSICQLKLAELYHQNMINWVCFGHQLCFQPSLSRYPLVPQFLLEGGIRTNLQGGSSYFRSFGDTAFITLNMPRSYLSNPLIIKRVHAWVSQAAVVNVTIPNPSNHIFDAAACLA